MLELPFALREHKEFPYKSCVSFSSHGTRRIPHGDSTLEWPSVVGHSALHREATGEGRSVKVMGASQGGIF